MYCISILIDDHSKVFSVLQEYRLPLEKLLGLEALGLEASPLGLLPLLLLVVYPLTGRR